MSMKQRPRDVEAVMRSISAIEPAERDHAPLASIIRTDRTPFVSRERELADLRSCFETAVSGRPSLALVSGEAGVGKTRLVEELARYAVRRGGKVFWGQCVDGAPPLWTWIQVIRDYLAVCDARTIAAELGGGGSLIASVVPEMLGLVPNLVAATTFAETSHGRFHLFDAVKSFLKKVAITQPLVIVLDDFHYIDSDSLDLLQFLAAGLRGSRVLMVALYRTARTPRANDLSRALGGIACERRYLALRNLGDSDVATFIEEVAGLSPSTSLAHAVFRRTEGNPFFIRELVQALLDDGGLGEGAEDRADTLPPPLGVRDALAPILRELSTEAYAALSIAAVLGREFSLSTLRAACGGSFPRLAEAIEDGERREIIRTVGDDRYRFVYALVREVLEEEVPSRRRAEVLRNVETMDFAIGDDDRANPSAPEQRNAFLRAGDHWTISFEGSVFYIKDSIGLRYLAYLLTNPGRKIPSVDLVLFAEGVQPDGIRPRDSSRDRKVMEVGFHQRHGFGDAGEVIDRQAEHAYRRRWEDLDAELSRAKASNDFGLVDALTREREFLVRELTAGFGMNGRSRKAASFAERARLNVTRAIRSAIDRIAEYDRPLAAHLRATIETGKACSYTPDSADAKLWAV